MTATICITLIGLGLCALAHPIIARTTSSPYTVSTLSPRRPTTNTDRHGDYGNQPRIIEQFNHRNPDGSYEFRYELSDGNTRYERGYFVNRNNAPSLVVNGYYAYRLEDGRYTTVFYNADHNGYRQQASTTSQRWPDLPRTLEVTTEDGDGRVVSGLVTRGGRRYAEEAEDAARVMLNRI